jgi:hypothetical protein
VATPFIELRNAVCKCLNDGLQPLLDACGVAFEVADGLTRGKRSTSACCAYQVQYDMCKENELHINVYAPFKQWNLEESIAECRTGKVKKLQNLTVDYTIMVEVLKVFCGKPLEGSCDIAPTAMIDELESLMESIEVLLMCKRELIAGGHKFWMEDTDPISLGWDQRSMTDRAMFISQTSFTYKHKRCCPEIS